MDRRGFFKSMLGKGLSQGAKQVDAVILPFERAAEAAKAALPDDAFDEPDAPLEDDAALAPLEEAIEDGDTATAARRALPAEPVAEPCAIEDVMRLAADCGLVRRVEAVAALARQSVRMVPADADPDSIAAPAARSRFGGVPDLPAGLPWPRWRSAPLTFLAQIDLAEVAAAGLDAGTLPDRGLLLLFSVADVVPSGRAPGHFASTRALIVDGDQAAADRSAPAGRSLPAEPVGMALSVEWTVPAVGSERVRALALDVEEQAAWERLRALLAERQGVELEDADEDLIALHRLLGDPDDEHDGMPLVCELTARGVDVEAAGPDADPLADEHRDRAARWRLLAQLTADDHLGWSWGDGRERLLLWIDAADLPGGLMAGVRAIAR